MKNFCEKSSSLSSPLEIVFLMPIKGVLKRLSCENINVKNLRPSLPLEIFSRADKGGAKMTMLRKISVKKLCTYHPLSKNLSCADKGGLKMAEVRNNFCEKPPSLPRPIFFACRQRGPKVIELRKKSVKTLRRSHSLRKISRADKGSLKMAELRKKFCQNPPSKPSSKNFACRQRDAKMTEFRKISVKRYSSVSSLLEKFFSSKGS